MSKFPLFSVILSKAKNLFIIFATFTDGGVLVLTALMSDSKHAGRRASARKSQAQTNQLPKTTTHSLLNLPSKLT